MVCLGLQQWAVSTFSPHGPPSQVFSLRFAARLAAS